MDRLRKSPKSTAAHNRHARLAEVRREFEAQKLDGFDGAVEGRGGHFVVGGEVGVAEVFEGVVKRGDVVKGGEHG